MLRAILFDLDGVLIDSEGLHTAAAQAALAEHGVHLPRGLIDQFIGTPDVVFMQHASQTYLQGRIAPADLLASKQRIYLQTEERMQAVPGAIDFLHAVRPQTATALVTSSLRHNQELAFARFGLAPCFDAVVTAEDVTHTKPHPEPYLTAVVRLGIPAAECLVIEDSLHGLAAARAAGCCTLALATSCPVDTLTTAGADYVCKDYAEVAAVWECVRGQ